MYGVDVHPDGTRFATASGDGTVKIWSMGGLFGGKFDSNDDKNGHKKTGNKPSCSQFTENGHYVSSNSEGEQHQQGYDTSSSMEVTNHKQTTENSTAVSQTTQNHVPVQGVNDLTGLVRKKKNKGSNNNAIRSISTLETTKPPSLTTATTPNKADANNAGIGSTNINNAAASESQQPTNQSQTSNNNFSTTAAPTNKQPKLLTTISSSSTGSILALRFSPSGQYLATAGDDSYVNIYVRSASPVFKGNLVGVDSQGNKRQNNERDVEHWNRIAIGRGHALDVVGLAWAPDDSHLVSCSLDSVHPVIVWRLFDVLISKDENGVGDNHDGGGKNGIVAASTATSTIHNLHPFKVLGRDVHTSTVKGVAFDPAGKYIATSGDDPAICIWRAFDDWGLEARIDSSSGVFRSKKRKRKSGQDGGGGQNEEEDDPGELASLSLFRRISFAPELMILMISSKINTCIYRHRRRRGIIICHHDYKVGSHEDLYICKVNTKVIRERAQRDKSGDHNIKNFMHEDMFRYKGCLPIDEVYLFRKGKNGNFSDDDGKIVLIRKNGNLKKCVWEEVSFE
eukprot:scaffold249348_cov72-Cyclotella_meneghiniana.AAC.1